MSQYDIMAVTVNHRKTKAGEVQKTLTDYGCSIKMRLGLHEAGGNVCADDGLMILQLCGDPKEMDALHTNLNKINGVKAERLTIKS